METRILVGLFLACTVAGLPAGQVFPEGIGITPMDEKLFNQTELFVLDDNNNPVQLTLGMSLNEEDEEEIDKDLENRVLFLLYTLKNPDKPRRLYLNNVEDLKSSDFDPKKSTRIVTHGWKNSANSSACISIRDAYLRDGDYNVIVVDWSNISEKFYIVASSQVPKVGHLVSKMLMFLYKQGMNLSKVCLLGHSLGAHVVGLAAYKANGTVACVVGMDPALPLFWLAGPNSRISTESAEYVEIIHTNAGFLGIPTPIGHADYYPNGGTNQRGCMIDIVGACSHSRSHEYIAESINSSEGFYGKKCGSYIQYMLGLCNRKQSSIMGSDSLNFKKEGIFYLTTKSTPPFAKGKE